MQINREDHPVAKFVRDDEGAIHVTDAMGDPWCDMKEEEPDLFAEDMITPISDDEVTREDMCEMCLEAAEAEGFITV